MVDSAAKSDAFAFSRRVRNVIDDVALDGLCRERLDEALKRFAELESHRHRRNELKAARERRDQISNILSLLSELDDISWDDADPSVYLEMALLFVDIARSAQVGADAMRSLAGERGKQRSRAFRPDIGPESRAGSESVDGGSLE